MPFAKSRSNFIFASLSAITTLAALSQLAIDHSVSNTWSVLFVVIAALSTLQYSQVTRAFDDCPVSSLALMGLCITTQWTSLVAQTLSGNALVEGLRVPELTFGALLAIQLLAIATHWVYRSIAAFVQLRNRLTANVLVPLGAFRVLSPSAIWVLSLLGALSAAVGGAQVGDSGGKLFQAMSFFAWLPTMLPILYWQHGKAYCRIERQVPWLIAYVALLVVIGIARNGRSLMIVGPVQAALVSAMFMMRDRRPLTPRLMGGLAIAAALSFLLMLGAKDLATAMVVVRESRSTLSPIQMVEETVAALGDRQKLAVYVDRTAASGDYDVYEESYLDNPLLARFSETKFHDNMFDILRRLNLDERAEIAEMTKFHIIALLPQPFIDKLGLDVDKVSYFFSMGDFYRSFLEGEGHTLGVYAVGSIWADVWAIFGLWSPLFVYALFLAIFALLDSLSYISQSGRLMLSPVVVCTVWAIFLQGLSADSLATKASFFVRGFPQQLLLYCILAWMVSRAFPIRLRGLEQYATDPSKVSKRTAWQASSLS